MGITPSAKIGSMAVVAMCVHLFQQIYHVNVDITSKTRPSNACGCGLDQSASLEKYLVCAIQYSSPDNPLPGQRNIVKYMVDKLDVIRTMHPDCGVVHIGDFNRLGICDLLIHQYLKQIVRTPHAANSCKSLFATNLHELYNDPSIIAPLSTSDLNVVKWIPSVSGSLRSHSKGTSKKHVRRFHSLPVMPSVHGATITPGAGCKKLLITF